MSDPALTVSEEVREMAELCRDEASTVEKYHPRTAEVIRRVTERFERVVQGRGPEWIPLGDLERTKGWSRKWLREKARELAETGKARKDPYWEIRADAAREIPVKADHERGEIPMGDLEDTAERLAAEV